MIGKWNKCGIINIDNSISIHFSSQAAEKGSPSKKNSKEQIDDSTPNNRKKARNNKIERKHVSRDTTLPDLIDDEKSLSVKSHKKMCKYFLKGKCHKGTKCRFSHKVISLMRFRLK